MPKLPHLCVCNLISAFATAPLFSKAARKTFEKCEPSDKCGTDKFEMTNQGHFSEYSIYKKGLK